MIIYRVHLSIISTQRRIMKKYSNQQNALRPIPSALNSPVSFRKMVKYRNQAYGSAAMTPNLRHHNLNSTRHSLHTQSQVINRYSEAKSPIKDFVKDHLKRADKNDAQNQMNTSRS